VCVCTAGAVEEWSGDGQAGREREEVRAGEKICEKARVACVYVVCVHGCVYACAHGYLCVCFFVCECVEKICEESKGNDLSACVCVCVWD